MTDDTHPGLTIFLPEYSAKLLFEIRDKLNAPTAEGALRIALERQHMAMVGSIPTGKEDRPLVVIGQGDSRIEIREGDV